MPMPFTPAPTGKNNAPSQGANASRITPFTKASGEHVEKMTDTMRLQTTSEQALNPISVTAFGFIAAVVIEVTASGATGTATMNADGPFNVLKGIRFAEPNGQLIHNFPTGYHLYLANKWGGYRYGDPKSSPSFSAPDAAGNYSFTLRIPIMINSRNALGALANQNSAAQYQIHMAIAAASEVYSTAPTTLPTVRIRTHLEAWEQPESMSGGLTNATTPPAPGTTQFWNVYSETFGAGENSITFRRVGNYVRNWLFDFRDTNGSRINAESSVLPDDLTIKFDHRVLKHATMKYYRDFMGAKHGFGLNGIARNAANGIESGLVVESFTHDFDGTAGTEQNDLWFPTLDHSRVELNFVARASGSVTIMTNDVAIMGDVFA